MQRRIVLGLSLAAVLAAAAAFPAPHPRAALVPEGGAAASTAAPTPRARRSARPRRGHRRKRTSPHRRRGSPHPKQPVARIDLNRADAATLARAGGIGERLAERIVAFRRLNGPFENVDELADVDGITERRLETLSRYVIVR